MTSTGFYVIIPFFPKGKDEKLTSWLILSNQKIIRNIRFNTACGVTRAIQVRFPNAITIADLSTALLIEHGPQEATQQDNTITAAGAMEPLRRMLRIAHPVLPASMDLSFWEIVS
jgi:hypothetical protein